MDWAILLGFAFTWVAWLGTIFRIMVRKRLDLVDWFVGTLGGFNGVGYAFIIWATQAGINPHWERWILPYSRYYWLPPILSLIAAGGVWMGATLAGASWRSREEHAELTPRAVVEIRRFAWVFLFAGIFCYYLYTMAYGGFAEMLNYSALIRSGMFDAIGIDNPLSFLKRFGGFAFFSSLLFYALVLEDRPKGHLRIICLLGLVTSIGFSLYVLYSWLSRVAIAMYLSAFPLAYVYHRSHQSHMIIFRLTPLVLAIAIGLPFLSLWMTPGKSSTSIIEFYARELSFPIISLFSAIENDRFRFFFDLAVAPIYMLPSRIWSGVFGLDVVSNINTETILGYVKGEGGVTGTIPVDMVTFGYMQMGAFGVAIIGFCIGAGLVWLEKLIQWMPGKGLRSVLYAYSALMVSTLTVLYADPQHILYRNFHFIIGTLALATLVSWKRLRRESTQCFEEKITEAERK